MQDKHQYRLLEPNEDYREAVIEKAGITATFTLAEVEAMQGRNKTSKKETEAQIMLEKAKMTNIENHYPFVKDLDGLRLTAAALYKEAKTYVEKAEPMLASLDAAIAENDAMIATVMDTLGLKKSITSDKATSNGKATSKRSKK